MRRGRKIASCNVFFADSNEAMSSKATFGFFSTTSSSNIFIKFESGPLPLEFGYLYNKNKLFSLFEFFSQNEVFHYF